MLVRPAAIRLERVLLFLLQLYRQRRFRGSWLLAYFPSTVHDDYGTTELFRSSNAFII